MFRTIASRKSLALLTVWLASCASAPIVKPALPPESARAEVLVFRVSAFSAGGVALSVGVDAAVYAEIRNDEYVSVYVAPGNHAFFVQARSNGEPAAVSHDLKAGERRCLRTTADSMTNLARNVHPGNLMANGYGFALQEVPCPPADMLAKYGRVEVEYVNAAR